MAARKSAWIVALVLWLGAACTTLGEERGPPTEAELSRAIERVDELRERVIEASLASTIDSDKDFWIRVLELLGDHREDLIGKRDRVVSPED